jgi:hypothetical protein
MINSSKKAAFFVAIASFVGLVSIVSSASDKTSDKKGGKTNSPFTQTIEVKKTSENSFQAKEEALMEAEEKAFSRMMKSLGAENQKIESGVSGRLLDNMEIVNESIGIKTYKAEIKYHFNQAKTESLLSLAREAALEEAINNGTFQPTAQPVGQPANQPAKLENPVRENLSELDTSKQLVLMQISGLKEWADLRKTLMQTNGVQGINVSAISETQVDFYLLYRGDAAKIKNSLKREGYKITEVKKGSGYWTLHQALAR